MLSILNITKSIIKPEKSALYQIATQNLVKDLPLHSRNDQAHHGGVNVMSYATEKYHKPHMQEHAGVVHLIHGWPMQGQRKR